MDHERLIKEYSTSFRVAIEKSDKKLLPISFQNFPKGACGDTTPLLGAYLLENNLGQFNYVLGKKIIESWKKGRWVSHAWLQNDRGLIVDITADQFEDITEKVIVTFRSSWHSSFKVEILHKAHFNIYDEYTKNTLEDAYRVICKYLK